jgi:hypothetical protein
MTGNQRGHTECVRNGEADEARIHRRRVNHHVEVLQQRIESGAVGRVLREVGRKRVVVHDHQEEEEHLHNRDDRNDVGNELAMALAIDVHRDGTEYGQQ